MLFEGSTGPSKLIRKPRIRSGSQTVSFVDEYMTADLSSENDRISCVCIDAGMEMSIRKTLERNAENIPLRFRHLVMRELLVALKRL